MTSAADSRPAALSDQLVWVHDLLRRDLDAVRRLAVEAAGDGPASSVRSGLAALESRGPLFRLRTTCLAYCQTLHGHHAGESDVLFPAVRRAAPHLADVLDRLEDEHRAVAALLDEVEGLAGSPDDLGSALTRLADVLEEHLRYEEEHLVPVLAGWTEWPQR